jgi:hypothetical protein
MSRPATPGRGFCCALEGRNFHYPIEAVPSWLTRNALELYAVERLAKGDGSFADALLLVALLRSVQSRLSEADGWELFVLRLMPKAKE